MLISFIFLNTRPVHNPGYDNKSEGIREEGIEITPSSLHALKKRFSI
jgi:hypothetical protein